MGRIREFLEQGAGEITDIETTRSELRALATDEGTGR